MRLVRCLEEEVHKAQDIRPQQDARRLGHEKKESLIDKETVEINERRTEFADTCCYHFKLNKL